MLYNLEHRPDNKLLNRTFQVFSSVPLTFAGHKWKFSASDDGKKGLLLFSNTN